MGKEGIVGCGNGNLNYGLGDSDCGYRVWWHRNRFGLKRAEVRIVAVGLKGDDRDGGGVVA